MQLLNSYCFKPFLQFTTSDYYKKSLIPHRVKCRTEAVNNLSRPLETWKMLKLILSKRKLIKISESVLPHQTVSSSPWLRYASNMKRDKCHLFLQHLQIQTRKRQMWGNIAYYVLPSEKVRGTRPPLNCAHE